jgi:hypothetical protein
LNSTCPGLFGHFFSCCIIQGNYFV